MTPWTRTTAGPSPHRETWMGTDVVVAFTRAPDNHSNRSTHHACSKRHRSTLGVIVPVLARLHPDDPWEQTVLPSQGEPSPHMSVELDLDPLTSAPQAEEAAARPRGRLYETKNDLVLVAVAVVLAVVVGGGMRL